MATVSNPDWDSLLNGSADGQSVNGNLGHGDLLATLLGEADQLQGCSLGVSGNEGGADHQATHNGLLLSQAEELDILALLGSGDLPDMTARLPSPAQPDIANSPQSVGSTTAYSTSTAASPLSSVGSGSGRDADISSASSPESVASSMQHNPSNQVHQHCYSADISTGAASNMVPMSLEGLLAGTDLPSMGPGLITEEQLTSLHASFELPRPVTARGTKSLGQTSLAGVDFSAFSTTMTSSSSAITTDVGRSPAQDVSIDLSFSADPTFSSTFSDDLAGAPESQGITSADGRERLVLSSEEKRLLAAENFELPQYLPLTKQEEKNLKRVRRKIKNKISALDSRKRKKEYVDGLETRVESTTGENRRLQSRVRLLEDTNKNLMVHLKKLQDLVVAIYPTAKPMHTGVAVFVLSFALFLMPGYLPSAAPTAMEVSMAYVGGKVRTRVLLAPEVSLGHMTQEQAQPPTDEPPEQLSRHSKGDDQVDKDKDSDTRKEVPNAARKEDPDVHADDKKKLDPPAESEADGTPPDGLLHEQQLDESDWAIPLPLHQVRDEI